MPSKLWYLGQSKLFKEMTPEEMHHINEVTEMTETEKFKPIYLPHDNSERIYLVKKGKVKINKLLDNGNEITMAILGPGDFFGEMTLVDQEPRLETAYTLEDTLLCIIERNNFEELLDEKPKLCRRVTKLMGLKLKTIENRFINLISKDARQRLESLLKELAEEFGKEHSEGTLIDINLSNKDLGSLIDATRQTVSEHINQLKRENKIRYVDKKILLLLL